MVHGLAVSSSFHCQLIQEKMVHLKMICPHLSIDKFLSFWFHWQKLSFLLNQSKIFSLISSQILSPKGDVNLLRGALQNRGPQHGELFTSTQKRFVSCEKITPNFLSLAAWDSAPSSAKSWFEKGFKYLCTINSKLFFMSPYLKKIWIL